MSASHIPAGDDEVRGLPIDRDGAVITVGTFDGVHRGHQDVLRRLVQVAAAQGRPSLVVTFEPHPLEVVRPREAPPLLTLLEEKLAMFVQCGVHYVAVLPFTPQLAACDAATFVDLVLRDRYSLAELLMGHDHGFGRNRHGDIDVLRRLGRDCGFGVTVLPPVPLGTGEAISSSAIRNAVRNGALSAAKHALGRWYSLSGRVVGGDRRGRLLGYPTINVTPPPPRKLLPPDGVYAVRVQTPRGPFGAMANLGPRPTFDDHQRRVEAHLFDTDVQLYGASVQVDFIEQLRETRQFSGPDALRAQLALDEAAARGALTGAGQE